MPHKYFIDNSISYRTCTVDFQHTVLSSSLIDRRGLLPLDEAIPAASVSEIELPPFVAKNDAHMVG